MGIISLKYDFAFKHIMRNELVRRHFISDVLGIPLSEIRSVRLVNPFLWKRRRRLKEGILDILLELNDDAKINIELQIKSLKHWDRRVLFYLSKMFTESLLSGEKYTKLKKCISIGILDFNLDARPEYHRVYRLRDKEGFEFSDMFEIHIIELGKTPSGRDKMDDWIRLFNAKTQDDLDNLQTDNPGILEAVNEVKLMGLVKGFLAEYEAHMKSVRDRNARDDYVREQGIEIGTIKGMDIGRIGLVRKKAAKNISAHETAEFLEEDSSFIEELYRLIQSHPDWNDEKIYYEFHEKNKSIPCDTEKNE